MFYVLCCMQCTNSSYDAESDEESKLKENLSVDILLQFATLGPRSTVVEH